MENRVGVEEDIYKKCDENRYIGTNDGDLKKDFSFFYHVPVEFFGTLFHV